MDFRFLVRPYVLLSASVSLVSDSEKMGGGPGRVLIDKRGVRVYYVGVSGRLTFLSVWLTDFSRCFSGTSLLRRWA